VEREHEEHVGRPLADALDGGQLADHLAVRQVVEPVELDLAGQDVLRQRSQVGDLGAREPARRAQRLGVVGEDLLRRRRAAAEALEQPAPDRGRRLDRELLARDRAHERRVALLGAAAAVAVGRQRAAEVVDQARHHRVGAAQVGVGASHGGAG
jgi:hypothetical protein